MNDCKYPIELFPLKITNNLLPIRFHNFVNGSHNVVSLQLLTAGETHSRWPQGAVTGIVVREEEIRREYLCSQIKCILVQMH